MSGATKKTAPSAKTPRAEESKHGNYPAIHDWSVDAAIDAIDYAQQQMRTAGVALVHGNLPACVGAFEASRKAVCAAHDSLVGLIGGA
jgi:hypothetical protein